MKKELEKINQVGNASAYRHRDGSWRVRIPYLFKGYQSRRELCYPESREKAAKKANKNVWTELYAWTNEEILKLESELLVR